MEKKNKTKAKNQNTASLTSKETTGPPHVAMTLYAKNTHTYILTDTENLKFL